MPEPLGSYQLVMPVRAAEPGRATVGDANPFNRQPISHCTVTVTFTDTAVLALSESVPVTVKT
jgi:hypothetical protein